MKRLIPCILAALLLLSVAVAQSILVGHYDLLRTAANSVETVLTPANAGRIHRLAAWTLDAPMNAHPVYAPGVTVGGVARNLIIAATWNNTVYALNANLPGSTPLWSRNLGTPRNNWPLGNGMVWYAQPAGIATVPAIDTASQTVFVVAQTQTPQMVLNKINLSDGTVAASTVITGSVTGTGDPGTSYSPADPAATEPDNVSGGILTFFPKYAACRGVTVYNGIVYVNCGSNADYHPWHGWIFAYNVSDLSPAGVWCSSPNDWGGGLWWFPAIDSTGIYVITGNGAYDGVSQFGFSAVKLNFSLVMQDWYSIPASDLAAAISNDSDLGSSPPILVAGTNLLLFGGKAKNATATGYSLDKTCMGQQGGLHSGCAGPQLVNTCTAPDNYHAGIYNNLYFPGLNLWLLPCTDGSIYSFTRSGSTFSPTATTASTFPDPGAASAGGVNGSSNGIAWSLTAASNASLTPRAGTLRAFNPSTLAELYSSTTVASDALGQLTKWNIPLVVNGRVYVSTYDSQIVVYGIPNVSAITGPLKLTGPTRIQ
jgi:hypothetical protein